MEVIESSNNSKELILIFLNRDKIKKIKQVKYGKGSYFSKYSDDNI